MKEERNQQIRRIVDLFEFRLLDLKKIPARNFSLGDLHEGDWKFIKKF